MNENYFKRLKRQAEEVMKFAEIPEDLTEDKITNKLNLDAIEDEVEKIEANTDTLIKKVYEDQIATDKEIHKMVYDFEAEMLIELKLLPEGIKDIFFTIPPSNNNNEETLEIDTEQFIKDDMDTYTKYIA